MRGSASSARAIEISCRSPAERPDAALANRVLEAAVEPRRDDRSTPIARGHVSSTSASVASGRANRMLSAMVPENRNGSCSTTPSWRR